MSRFRNLFVGATAALTLATLPADAASRYFQDATGKWRGSGSIVAGKYKGTRFNCTLHGAPETGRDLTIAGSCRVGLFTQKVSARIVQHGRSFRGTFLDGAQGKGLDIRSGRLDRRKLTVDIHSKGLKGAIVANLVKRNKMRVTVSVRVSSGQLVPVVALDLDKTGR